MTLCAFSPQRQGYTMKSLKPGLVGMGGGGGARASSSLPLRGGLTGVVLMTETKTRFGESPENKITGAGPGLSDILRQNSPPFQADPALLLPTLPTAPQGRLRLALQGSCKVLLRGRRPASDRTRAPSRQAAAASSQGWLAATAPTTPIPRLSRVTFRAWAGPIAKSGLGVKGVTAAVAND